MVIVGTMLAFEEPEGRHFVEVEGPEVLFCDTDENINFRLSSTEARELAEALIKCADEIEKEPK